MHILSSDTSLWPAANDKATMHTKSKNCDTIFCTDLKMVSKMLMIFFSWFTDGWLLIDINHFITAFFRCVGMLSNKTINSTALYSSSPPNLRTDRLQI